MHNLNKEKFFFLANRHLCCNLPLHKKPTYNIQNEKMKLYLMLEVQQVPHFTDIASDYPFPITQYIWLWSDIYPNNIPELP